eukprot:6353463-Pyramimonas_sp.AAC.1
MMYPPGSVFDVPRTAIRRPKKQKPCPSPATRLASRPPSCWSEPVLGHLGPPTGSNHRRCCCLN